MRLQQRCNIAEAGARLELVEQTPFADVLKQSNRRRPPHIRLRATSTPDMSPAAGSHGGSRPLDLRGDSVSIAWPPNTCRSPFAREPRSLIASVPINGAGTTDAEARAQSRVPTTTLPSWTLAACRRHRVTRTARPPARWDLLDRLGSGRGRREHEGERDAAVSLRLFDHAPRPSPRLVRRSAGHP